MLKALSLCLVVVFCSLSIDSVRDLYKEASKSKANTEEFYAQLKSVKNSDNAVLVGYKAAAIALKARFEKPIKSKKQLFLEAKTLLEKQIERKPNEIELRLIRLSIQENTPKILKYKGNMNEDKNFILKNISAVKNKKQLDYFKAFVAQSKSFTSQEKNTISKR